MALGIAPLTVNEQTTMLATIADNGVYHQAHVIKYWQQGDGTEQLPKLDQHIVLNPTQDAQVQYAMEQTTIDGTAAQTVTFGQQAPGTVIGKTGTTSSSHSGFFIGSTSQYTLVVGMFTSSQDTNSNDNLAMLGGGGFGGYWPAKIWNTFAQDKFSTAPTLFPTNPAFTGSTWNLLGKVTKPKPTVTCTVNGHKKKISGKSCPTQDNGNNATPTCTSDQNGNVQCSNGATCTYNQSGNLTCDNGATCTSDQSGNLTCTGAGATPTATATCQNPNDPACSSSNGNNNGTSTSTPTVSSTQGGLAIGGGLMLLPGSLLWTTMSRRRQRKKRAGKAE
jgi:membrane peptidoglycan carboxypeptidase